MGNKMKLRILSGLCLLMLAIGQDFLITDSQIDASISETSLNLEDANLGADGLPDYSNQTKWGGVCNTGTSQSPIDIKESVAIQMNEVQGAKVSQGYVTVSQQGTSATLSGYKVDKKNFYTVTPSVASTKLPITITTTAVDNEATVLGIQYASSFHFHAPSEHQINGKSFALEMHVPLGQISATGLELKGVLSVLFQKGESNTQLENLKKNQTVDLQKLIGAKTIKIKAGDTESDSVNSLGQVYYYKGSLTTPNCTEGMQWIVNADIQTATDDQLKEFTNEWKDVTNEGGPKGINRKVQELGDRKVYSYGVSSGKMFGLVALILALIL